MTAGAAHTANAGRGRVAPTRRGKVLIVEGFLMYLFARAVAIDELYILALAALTFPLFSLGFVAMRRHRLDLSRTIAPRRVFAGGTIKLSYGVRNLARASSPPVILDDACPRAFGGPVRVALPSLTADRHGSILVERGVGRRGLWTVGPLRARIEDPFGLALLATDVGPDAALVVYPRIEVLHETTPRDPRPGGGRSSLFQLASAAEEFYSIRDWQHGDDLRKVHWRSSAKRGRLQIRQDEVRPFPRATVVLDTALDHPEALEWAVSAAASAIWELARQGFGVRLATSTVAPGSLRWGREAADPLLTILAGVHATPDEPMLQTIRRITARAGAGGILLAVIPPGEQTAMTMLARARSAYDWAGAALVDQASFAGVTGRERAEEDQRIAQAERTLARAGWHVTGAGINEGCGKVWQRLTESGTYRPSSPSQHL
jgi:uncharacterized protein (DUF58 family)